MGLQLCTFTGCDSSSSISELISIQQEFPFIEYGVLFNSAKVGTGRYPSVDWIVKFLEAKEITNRAFHICGDKLLTEFITSPETKLAKKNLWSDKTRIQLNFAAKAFTVEQLNKAINSFAPTPIITQHNKSKENLWKEIPAKNHHILFDASGGRGTTRTEWPSTLLNRHCGFAGGLGPDNLSEQLILIDKAADGYDYWIDMETNVRTDDKFDLVKVRKCAEIVSSFLRTCVPVMKELDVP